MKHLSALDAIFLHLETPETPMHVGSLMVLEKPKGKRDAYAAIRDHAAKRLPLPAPGGEAQLEAAVAKLHEGALDRDRPLWQFTVIDGLKNGEVGFYAKIHHSALDGQGGIAVAQALLDAQPKARPVQRPGEESGARIAPSAAR